MPREDEYLVILKWHPDFQYILARMDGKPLAARETEFLTNSLGELSSTPYYPPEHELEEVHAYCVIPSAGSSRGCSCLFIYPRRYRNRDDMIRCTACKGRGRFTWEDGPIGLAAYLIEDRPQVIEHAHFDELYEIGSELSSNRPAWGEESPILNNPTTVSGILTNGYIGAAASSDEEHI